VAGKQLVRRGKAAEAARQWALMDIFTLDPSLVYMPPPEQLAVLTRPRHEGGYGLALSQGQLARDLAAIRALHADMGAGVSEELRGQEVLALQKQIAALWPAVLAGESRANESMTKARERLHKLTGLDLDGKDGPRATNIKLEVAYVDDWRPKALPAPAPESIIEARATAIEEPA
jgi:hypothetical protein